jgi:hypothetical protein
MSPMGRHTCPSCAKRSQIRRSVAQFLITAVIFWAVAIPFMIFLYRRFGGLWDLFGIVPGVIVALPCDRMLDERFRGLEPIKKDDDAA